MSEKDVFLKNMTAEARKKYEEMLNELISEKDDTIRKEIKIDQKHLEMVNKCAITFSAHTKISIDTGFELLLFEPLYRKGIKNYDIALYNEKSKQMILIECKSSIKHIDGIAKHIEDSISDTEKNKHILEEIIGDELKDIEYVYFIPAEDAEEFSKLVKEQELPICIWRYWAHDEIIEIVDQKHPDFKTAAIDKGHFHKNQKLTRILSDGIDVSKNPARQSSFLPSSHIYTILIDVTMTLVSKMSEIKNWNGEFSFGDVFHIVRSSIATPNTLTDDDLYNISEQVVKKGIIKQIYKLEDDEKEIKIQKMNLNNKATKISLTYKFVTENYVVLNAQKMAYDQIEDKFRKEMNVKDLTYYFK